MTTSTAYEQALAALGQCTHLFYLQSTLNWIQAYKADCSAWEWEQVREAYWRRLLVLEKPLLHEEWGFSTRKASPTHAELKVFLHHTTDKAYLVNIIDDPRTPLPKHWVPRSQAKLTKTGPQQWALSVPLWLAERITANKT